MIKAESISTKVNTDPPKTRAGMLSCVDKVERASFLPSGLLSQKLVYVKGSRFSHPLPSELKMGSGAKKG